MVGECSSSRWLWTDCRHVRNELIRGETGWSTFEEREAKAMSDWAVRLVFEENKMSEIGRACLIEIGARSSLSHRDDHKKIESLESVISMYHSLSLGVRVPKHVSLLFYSHY